MNIEYNQFTGFLRKQNQELLWEPINNGNLYDTTDYLQQAIDTGILMYNSSDKQINSLDNLHNFIFHYNSLTKNWESVLRDNYNLLFSDNSNKLVLKSKSFDTLRELIIRTNGDQNKINDLLIK